MNSDSPQSPREALEARLTALLLGELPADEAAALRATLAQDAELARLHDRLQQTIALVRAAATAPELQTAPAPDAPRLAEERREKLLASFKAAPAKKLIRLRLPRVNWGKVKWREYAALAAMIVGLLGVAAVLMAPTLRSLNLMEELGEADSEGLFAFFDRRKSPQRVTTIGGTGPGSVSDGEPAVDAYAVVTVNAALASDFGLPAATPVPAKGFDLSGPAPVAVDNFTTTITPGLPVSRNAVWSYESAPATEPHDKSPALRLPLGGQAPQLAASTTPAPAEPLGRRTGSGSAEYAEHAFVSVAASGTRRGGAKPASTPAPADPRSGRDVNGPAEFDKSGLSYEWRVNGTTSDTRNPESPSPKQLAIALPTMGDALQDNPALQSAPVEFFQSGAARVVNGRELERLGDLSDVSLSGFFEFNTSNFGRDGQRQGGQGGGAGGAVRTGTGGVAFQSRFGNADAASSWNMWAAGTAPARPAQPTTEGIVAERIDAKDSGLAANAIGGLRFQYNKPADAPPPPPAVMTVVPPPVIVADDGANVQFETKARIEDQIALTRMNGSAGAVALDFTTARKEDRNTVGKAIEVESLAAVEPGTRFLNEGRIGQAALPPAPTPAPASQPPVEVAAKMMEVNPDPTRNHLGFTVMATNGAVATYNSFAAGKDFDSPARHDWFGVATPVNGQHFAGVSSDDHAILLTDPAGEPAKLLAPSTYSFSSRLSQVPSRPASGPEPLAQANNPVPAGAASAQGVYSVDAVGFGNVTVDTPSRQISTPPGQPIDESRKDDWLAARVAKPDSDGDGVRADAPLHFYRMTADAGSGPGKEAPVEAKKIAEPSKSERANVAITTGIALFDAPALQSIDESLSESGRTLGENTARDRLAGEQVARRESRFKIALPEGERGEALEKQRVASGPVVASEVMDLDPATGLPAQQNEFVELQNTSPKGDEKLAKLERELKTSISIRDRLHQRVWQDKVDQNMPKSSIVEVIDKAEAAPAKEKSFWWKVGGVFGGEAESTARISVEKDAKDLASVRTGAASVSGFDPFWVQSQFETIQSKAVLEKAAEKLNLNEAWADKYGGGQKLRTEDTVQLLKKKLDVRQNKNTSLIDIKARSDDAEEAARIANTVAEAYRDFRLERWKALSASGLSSLESELEKKDKQVAQVKQELEQRKKEVQPTQADVPLPRLAAGAPVPQPEVAATENAFSTFSLNVSDVSFKLAAASLEKGQMPDVATVRSEEFINAFDYRDPEPKGSAPIAFAWERARYPFAHDRDLVRFSVKTAASGRQPGRPLNLVLLLDNSGSMERADRVRIREACLRVLAQQLRPQDRVSLIAFARTSRLVVDGIDGGQAAQLPQWGGGLAPDGGTNLEEAMNLAYQTALRHFLANGVNRVVLLTDGAANLGDVEPESLKKKVEAHRKQGVALDCFGIGWDGLNDELLEALSRNGDGRYGFVNTPEAAQSEFAGQLAGALKVAASDVKVQVEWNPRRVSAYRQIGYAKHQLKKEQFRDNTVDAAEIGAAEAGNALYTVQVNPRGEGPLGTVRVRFKVPGTSDYREHEWPLAYVGSAKSLDQSSPALRLAASASAFSEWLVSSPFAAEVTPDKLLGYLGGVPETWPADPRPKKLEWMIRQAKSVSGK